jgi:hypothetical protein
MHVLVWVLAAFCASLCAEDGGLDRLRAAQPPKTDERITAYKRMADSKPSELHYQNLLAGAYIQKMRETTDFGYIDRAEKLVRNVLSVEPDN